MLPPSYEVLQPLSLARLQESWNPETALFDRQLRNRRWEPTHGTEDLTSTAIALIGLSRAGIGPGTGEIDWERTRKALIRLARRREYPGGLGVVIWANAVTEGPTFAELAGDLPWQLEQLLALSQTFQTMEIAWLLSGLAHELVRSPDHPIREAFQAALGALSSRFQPETRLFRHATSAAPLQRRVRLWVANFADQIYSIQALALASLVAGDSRALDIATQSAEKMIELQGELGQWWWHYDARDGRVCQAYPVYSVHQHGMAPMALLTLAAAGGPAPAAAIEKSRAWLDHNELKVRLIDPLAGTIWRDIDWDEGGLKQFNRHVRSVLGWKERDQPGTRRFKINYETRPYEWSWCLFASAIDGGQKSPLHIV
jgi:hypothetical protein